MSMQVNGMDDLLFKFEELERKAQKDIADKALNKSADIVKDEIISNAPEDSGALKSAIDKGDIKGSGTNRKIEIGNMNADSEVQRYFYYQEYGTTVMNGTKFMKRGFQDSIKEVNDIIKQTIIEELK